jgi:membrane protease YdiL (CAAX protease family)
MAETPSQANRSLPARIFLSPDEPRLRAGWRLALQTVLLFVFMFCAILPLGVYLHSSPLEFSDSLLQGLSTVIETFAITISVFLVRKFLDRRSFGSLGLKPDKWVAIDIFTGIAITFIMMSAIFLIEIAQGWLTFEGFSWQSDGIQVTLVNALIMLAAFVLVGWNEELLSRGYHLQTLASGLNLFWGVILSSAVFGILHLGNPNAESKYFVATGIFLAGLFLSYGYLTTRQLWLPIGLHIGWNFFEGVGFGFPVSGLDIYPITRIAVTGPQLWTGGAFGPEAGLVVLPGLALGAALIFLYAKYIRKTAIN